MSFKPIPLIGISYTDLANYEWKQICVMCTIGLPRLKTTGYEKVSFNGVSKVKTYINNDATDWFILNIQDLYCIVVHKTKNNAWLGKFSAVVAVDNINLIQIILMYSWVWMKTTVYVCCIDEDRKREGVNIFCMVFTSIVEIVCTVL